MNVLLVCPYDPHGGSYSFAAPMLGVWRLSSFLALHGINSRVFDASLLQIDPYEELALALRDLRPVVVGFSLTALTLPYDLSLVHWARSIWPDAVYVAGGIEATFNYEQILESAPIDFCVAGEGELPLLEICRSLSQNGAVDPRIPGLIRREAGKFRANPNCQLDYRMFRDSALSVPYNRMPIRAYWDRVRAVSGGGEQKASLLGGASIQEAKSIRVMTSNYCPMGCRFCCYTNFIRAACRRRAALIRLTADDIVELLRGVVAAYPDVETIIFQDDLFIHHNDKRIVELCNKIVKLKKEGSIREELSFMATTRIDTMTNSFLVAMRSAGFRLIGYGVESFSKRVLKEYRKEHIFPYIDSTLASTLASGIKPFLDIILFSPESTLQDVVLTLNRCVDYLLRGCEVSIYPVIIPFAGAKIVSDPNVADLIITERVAIPRTGRYLVRNSAILPRSRAVRQMFQTIEVAYQRSLADFISNHQGNRLPSRLRSVLYILAAAHQYPGLLSFPVERVRRMIAGANSKQRRSPNSGEGEQELTGWRWSRSGKSSEIWQGSV